MKEYTSLFTESNKKKSLRDRLEREDQRLHTAKADMDAWRRPQPKACSCRRIVGTVCPMEHAALRHNGRHSGGSAAELCCNKRWRPQLPAKIMVGEAESLSNANKSLQSGVVIRLDYVVLYDVLARFWARRWSLLSQENYRSVFGGTYSHGRVSSTCNTREGRVRMA